MTTGRHLLRELEARREWVDGRIAEAKRKGVRVDLERLAEHLGRAVAPCVDAVAAVVQGASVPSRRA